MPRYQIMKKAANRRLFLGGGEKNQADLRRATAPTTAKPANNMA